VSRYLRKDPPRLPLLDRCPTVPLQVSPVGHLESVPPAVPGTTEVSYPKRSSGRTAGAPGASRRALARAADAPSRAVTTELPKKQKARRRVTGRVGGGPNCCGCKHYQVIRRADQSLTYTGACLALERVVAANNDRACGVYEFWRTE
jgi:hypothetical protein